MFAADHRWQWEEWVDQHGYDRSRIRELKMLAADGFLLARKQSEDVRQSGVLLIDPTYGSDEIARVTAAGARIGTPAERAGVFPLEWASEPFHADLTGSFVKVLVRDRPDRADAVRQAEFAKLRTLQAWCRGQGKPLVLEVIVPRAQEPELEFERAGRPHALAQYIAAAYDAGIVPEYWKIEGMPDAAAMKPVDTAIAGRPHVRQLVLGKNADLETVARWFAAAAEGQTAGGFAVGRTLYWAAAIAYLEQRSSRERAAADIAAMYLQVVDLWLHPHRGASLAR
jgi:5-dehydro-2-deoxygluconokinase